MVSGVRVATLSRLLSELSGSALPGRRERKAGPPPRRRRFERRPVSIQSRVMMYDAEGRWAGEGEATISDLSPAGARLTAFTVPADLRLLASGSVVLFPREGQGRVALRARVVRFQAQKTPALGVCFREMTRPTRDCCRR